MRQDLTLYSNDELSLWVFNDEALYRMRNRSYLKDILDEHFIYSEAQYEQLIQDIEDDNKDGVK